MKPATVSRNRTWWLTRITRRNPRPAITELGLVRGLAVGDAVRVTVACPSPAASLREALREQVVGALTPLGAPVDVDVRGLTDEEAREIRRRLQPARPTDASQAFPGTRVFALSSGKGGVGKSSVSVNLAVVLAQRDHRVALIDADVYGFSVPRMIGIARQPTIVDNLVVPPRAHGVAVVSVALFADEETPVIWRGPMLHKMLSQFVVDVHWDEPELLIIDMPPGTGDVALTLRELVPATEVVVVTTPQPAAQKVAQRAAYMARKLDAQVTGVVENMSWFTGNDGVRYELFGSGGGELLAQQLGVPLLGRIPLVPALREGGDRGAPITATQPDSEAARALAGIADALLGTRRTRVPLPIMQSPD
jgi:ATP-binding protein involved in chromosome partitioning